jgi:CDP-diacylglycerol---serine O-phosphatidyltransferase
VSWGTDRSSGRRTRTVPCHRPVSKYWRIRISAMALVGARREENKTDSRPALTGSRAASVRTPATAPGPRRQIRLEYWQTTCSPRLAISAGGMKTAIAALLDAMRQGRYAPRVRRLRRSSGSRHMDLRKTLFVLPNLVTLASVFCGLAAILLVAEPRVSNEPVYRACTLLVFAMFFDLLDGRVARMTRTQSAFGLQLDSLADVVSFGVAPAVVVYQWSLFRLPVLGQFVAFFYVAAGAVRLARFNVLSSSKTGEPTKPGRHILGLPIPCAAAGLVAVVVADRSLHGLIGQAQNTPFVIGTTLALSLLMVSTIRFRSFKDLRIDARSIILVLFVLGTSAVVWKSYHPGFVLVWLLAMYVAIGLMETAREFAARLRHQLEERKSLPPPL